MESEAGKGSTFHFTILADSLGGLAAARPDDGAIQLGGRRVLIVDDNATNRRLRPSSGIMSNYLLTGIGICGVRGASLSVLTKGRGQGRATYVCPTNLNRGTDRCANALKMDLADAEQAVRSVFADLLAPDIMRDVINGALARLRPSLDAQAKRRVGLTRHLGQLERQIENLVNAIADGDDAGRLRGAIKDREHKATQIRTQLADLAQLDQVTAQTTELTDELEEILGEWRGWIGGHPQQARQILRSWSSAS